MGLSEEEPGGSLAGAAWWFDHHADVRGVGRDRICGPAGGTGPARGIRHNGLMDADVVVIGAGALGLSTALHCAMAGRSVAVVERRTAGSQASGRAAGPVQVGSGGRATDPAGPAQHRPRRSPSPTGPGAAGRSRPGQLPDRPDRPAPRVTCAGSWRSHGAGAPTCARQPGRSSPTGLSYYQADGDDFALWCPEDIYIEEPTRLIQACLAACRLHGAVIAENEPVTGISVTAGRVAGVETGRPADRGARGRGRGRRLGPPGRRAGRGAGAGRSGPPSAADHRAHGTGRPGRPDHPGGRRRRLPAPGPRRAHVRRVRAGPAAGRPAAPAALVHAPMTCRWTLACCASWRPRSQPRSPPRADRPPVAEHRGGLFTMSPDGRFVAGPVPDAARPVGGQRVQRLGLLLLASPSARRWPPGSPTAPRRQA